MAKIIIANWKMYLNTVQVTNLINEILSIKTQNEIIICPSLLHLDLANELLTNYKINLGAQNVAAFEQGAYTGEVSAQMLVDFCKYVLIGHNERRTIFNESNHIIASKVIQAQKYGLKTILCIGETEEVYNINQTKEFLNGQLQNSLPQNIDPSQTVIAYEPIWAIGTGLIPTNNEINEVIAHIKDITNNDFRVIYGGSVNSSNIQDLASIPNVDGFLVGKASINFDELKIIMQI